MTAPSFRAITTRYKGYNFRSRLEARWAVFFDHLGIRWDYESEGFELGNGLRYLPDFWLPDWEMWVEIKPGMPDDAAREKAWRLAEHGERHVFMSNGMPDNFGSLFSTFRGDLLHKYEYRATPGWHLETPKILVQDPKAQEEIDGWGFILTDQRRAQLRIAVAPPHPKRAPLSGRALDALEAARGARFEFGAKGGEV